MTLTCPTCDRSIEPSAAQRVLVYAATEANWEARLYSPIATVCPCGAQAAWKIPIGRILDWLRGEW